MWDRFMRYCVTFFGFGGGVAGNSGYADASGDADSAYDTQFISCHTNPMFSPAKSSAELLPVRLLLIDDHPVLLDSLAYYLAQHAQLEIVGTLNHGDQCLGCVEKYHPEVVVMDLSMPGLGVFERLSALLSPVAGHAPPAVLILTSDLGEHRLGELIDAGARGYLTKDSDGKKLVAAILALAQGNMYLHGDFRLSTPSVSTAPARSETTRENLSQREHQLLTLMAQGCSNKEIAHKLFLSTGTVKSYSSRMFDKLSVHGRTQAVLHALNVGLISATPRS